MFGGNSDYAFGRFVFVYLYPESPTDIGPRCFFKDIFELTQGYFFSLNARWYWMYFSLDEYKDEFGEKLIRSYKECSDINEKHARALADFKEKSQRKFYVVENSWRNLSDDVSWKKRGDLGSVKRSRNETECSDSDYYVRPKADEPQVKRLRAQAEWGVINITTCYHCKEVYEYRASTHWSKSTPFSCLDCDHAWRAELAAARAERVAAASSASAVQAVAGSAGSAAVISNCYNCPTRIWHIPRHAQDTAPRACAKCAGIAGAAEEAAKEPPRKTKRDSACAGVRCIECGRRFWGSRCMVCKCQYWH